MSEQETESRSDIRRRSALKAIFAAWLVAATLDITAATLNYLFTQGGRLTIPYQFIASGVFGRSAFSGGLLMAILGLLFHYTIALIWTLIFYFVYPRLMAFHRNRFVTGIIYGLVVWTAMNLVVLPLSGVPHIPFRPVQTTLAVLYVVFCIGVPISVIVGKYYSVEFADRSQAEIDNETLTHS
jgi:hypothetical protein